MLLHREPRGIGVPLGVERQATHGRCHDRDNARERLNLPPEE